MVLHAGAAEKPQWLLMVEPSFTDAKMRRTVEGSERTVVVAARLVDGEIVPLTREQKRGIPATFETVASEGRAAAVQALSKITPKFVRNSKGVIQYALLESDDPLTASTVLAPNFGEMFRETLGPDLLVAMPNRYQVFVFSRQDNVYNVLAETIISAYLSSNYPVSREIFALEKGRLISLAVYQ